MLYPLKLRPIFKSKIWGGTKLRTYFGKDIPDDNIGESWELCCRDDGMSVVENGIYKGENLQKIIDTYREKLLGLRIFKKYGTEFPLLIKILDANDRLSVQVHPDDNYAVLNGLDHGKDEMWYIIDAKENASLIYGLKKGTSRTELEKAIKGNRILQYLNEAAVKPGDFLYIPAGTVHAILGGLLIAEIQQNCNTTFRLYDWDRVDQSGKRRELHIYQALESIHFENKGSDIAKSGQAKYNNQTTIRKGPKVKEFQIDEINTNGGFDMQINPESFQVIMNLNGNGTISYLGGCINFNKGDTVLIPADIDKYSLTGNISTLLTYIPN
jgi:mannose-6-phosphate isomerase